MPLCQSCGDTGSGVYCSACGERREPRVRRANREPAVSPLHVREALFAQQREMEALYGVDDSPQTPADFVFRNASEMRWCNLRAAMQARMVFDEEWIVDTPRSELLWQATCLQQGIERAPLAATKTTYANDGPIGFTWWGSPLPQTVEIVDLGGEYGGLSRLKISVDLGTVLPGRRDEVLAELTSPGFGVPLSAFVLDEDGTARLVCSIAMDTSMIDEVGTFVMGMMSRQQAWGTMIRLVASAAELISPSEAQHPELGLRQDADELVSILFDSSPWEPVEKPGVSGPLSPEGFVLPDLSSAVLAHHLAAALNSEHETVESSGAEEMHLFSTKPSPDALGSVFAFLRMDNLAENVPALRRDPGYVMWLQRSLVSLPSEAEAHRMANEIMCALWKDSSHNILGNFRVVRTAENAVSIGGPVSYWSSTMLAALAAASEADAAETLWHVALHLSDQDEALLPVMLSSWEENGSA